MENSAILKFNKPIVLLGMMGVGKTTYGKKMAGVLKIPFFDVDQQVEADIGHSVAWIFENAGEKEFRKMEEQKIVEILNSQETIVLALGGGAFISKKTRDLVKKKAISVWLKTPPEVILKRVSVRKDRPLLEGEEDKLEKIRGILRNREDFYKQADITVETEIGGQKEVAIKIINGVEDYLNE